MRRPSSAWQLLILAALLVASGCDSTEIRPLGFDPFDTEGGVLSVYGYLETGTFDQTLRVQLLRRSIDRPTTAADAATGATVVTEALETGAQTLWEPRLVRFADSTYGEVFEAAFAPQAGETYQLTVERASARASAEVTIPPLPRGQLVRDTPARMQTVAWSPVTRLSTTRLVLRVGCGQGGIPVEVQNVLTVEPLGDETHTTVDLAAVRAYLNDRFSVPADSVLLLGDTSLTVTAVDAAWTLPADSTDLAQPGINANVEGGYGRFGALTRAVFTWGLTPSALDGLALERCP